MNVLGRNDENRENTINLNSTALLKDQRREHQLILIYFYLRRHMGEDVYAELDGKDTEARLYLPYRFMLAEIFGLYNIYGLQMLYLEENADSYIEIQFDTIVVGGEPRLLRLCEEAIAFAAQEDFAPAVYFRHSALTDYDWTALNQHRAAVVRTLGDQLIGNGYVVLHLKDCEPAEVTNTQLLDRHLDDTEYIEIISNLEPGKFVLIAPVTRDIVAAGFYGDEALRLYQILDGDVFDIARHRGEVFEKKDELVLNSK